MPSKEKQKVLEKKILITEPPPGSSVCSHSRTFFPSLCLCVSFLIGLWASSHVVYKVFMNDDSFIQCSLLLYHHLLLEHSVWTQLSGYPNSKYPDKREGSGVLFSYISQHLPGTKLDALCIMRVFRYFLCLLWFPFFPPIWFSSAGREAEHVSSPWGESSPEEIRFGSLTYSDPRERERDQHDKNKR